MTFRTNRKTFDFFINQSKDAVKRERTPMRSFWTFLTVAAFLLVKFVTNFLIGNPDKHFVVGKYEYALDSLFLFSMGQVNPNRP